jgi:hypothetical protein
MNIKSLINVYYINLTFSVLLTSYPCFAFNKNTGTSKFPFRAPMETF